jgi:CubicO group peptidase (beta-lactamase class C family)
LWLRCRRRRAPPGEAFIYSNPTYKLLNLVAEQVTGLPVHEAIRSEVLDPAGSPSTLLLQNAETPTPQPWALPLTSDSMDVADYGTGRRNPIDLRSHIQSCRDRNGQ